MKYIVMTSPKAHEAIGPFDDEPSAAEWVRAQADGDCRYTLIRLAEPTPTGCPRCGGRSCPNDDMGWCHNCQHVQADREYRASGEEAWVCDASHERTNP